MRSRRSGPGRGEPGGPVSEPRSPFLTGIFSIGSFVLAGAVFLVLREKAVTVAVTMGLIALVAPILWLLVSAMRPALPDRTCPSCNRESLRLLVPGVREGVRCPACGFQDAEFYVPYLIDVDDALDEEDKAKAAS